MLHIRPRFDGVTHAAKLHQEGGIAGSGQQRGVEVSPHAVAQRGLTLSGSLPLVTLYRAFCRFARRDDGQAVLTADRIRRTANADAILAVIITESV